MIGVFRVISKILLGSDKQCQLIQMVIYWETKVFSHSKSFLLQFGHKKILASKSQMSFRSKKKELIVKIDKGGNLIFFRINIRSEVTCLRPGIVFQLIGIPDIISSYSSSS